MPISKEAKDSLKESAKDQDKATELITKLSEIALGEFIEAIIRRVGRMSTGATVSNSKQAQAQLSALRQDMLRIIRKGGFKEAVLDYLRTFPKVEAHTIYQHKIISDLNVPKSLLKDSKQFSMQLYESLLLGDGMEARLVEPHIQRLQRAIITGGDKGHIAAEIVDFAQGNSGVVKYSGQVAQDGLAQFEGMINQKVGDYFGLEWSIFVGSIISTTRAACKKLVAQEYIHKSELPAFINWAFRNSSGMIPGTNADNWPVFRNGYGCRHNAVPISSSLVPDSAFERVGIKR